MLACIADPGSGRAVACIAGALARRLGGRLVLTTVQQPTPEAAWGDARPWLTFAARGLEPPPEVRVSVGEPAERLLAVAHQEAAQLLVVSTPGRSLRLGNVYLALASAAPCPVVIVPPRVSGLHDHGPIVCGVDGSPASQAAAAVAARLAARLESRLLLVEDDPPAEQLAGVAEREAAQLIVTGSHGRGGSPSMLLGSVASRLAVAATRPLVVVPALIQPGR